MEPVLNYTDLLMSNISYIIGAGIFVLIGKTINIAGSGAIFSVLLGGLVTHYIAHAYVKMYDTYHQNNSEFLGIGEIFGNTMQKITEILSINAIIFITYVVSMGFGAYFSSFLGDVISPFTGALIGLTLALGMNIGGIRMTANLNNIVVVVGVIGLLLISILGAIYILNNLSETLPNFAMDEINIYKIIYGAFIFYFAYTGFEMLIRLHKESLHGNVDIPKATYDSIKIVTSIYLAICIVMIGVLGSHGAGESNKPLAYLTKKLTNNLYINKYIEFSGVCLTWTTILFSLTHGSRLLTEFSKQNGNRYLSEINTNTKTPVNSITAIGILILILLVGSSDILTSSLIANGSHLLVMLIATIASKQL